jgi:environmental stress-induced protein Ves
MNVRPLPAGLRRYALDDLAPEPWRNGGGWTRTVATAAASDGTTPPWRVSAADISRDGAFSVFDGIDRSAVLLAGPGLTLTGPQTAAISFEHIGDQAAFAGELALQARLGSGPARLWNVMVERTRWRAEVRLHADAASVLPGGTHAVLLVCSGRLHVDDAAGALALALPAGEGLVLSNLPMALHLRALTPDTRWIHTALRPL